VRWLPGEISTHARKARTMPPDPPVKSGTPSKNAENQDAATLTRSQPSTTEELQARIGEPDTTNDTAPSASEQG
jgi:hypothetical protein